MRREEAERQAAYINERYGDIAHARLGDGQHGEEWIALYIHGPVHKGGEVASIHFVGSNDFPDLERGTGPRYWYEGDDAGALAREMRDRYAAQEDMDALVAEAKRIVEEEGV